MAAEQIKQLAVVLGYLAKEADGNPWQCPRCGVGVSSKADLKDVVVVVQALRGLTLGSS